MMASLEESFYGFRWTNPYGRIRLAELLLGFNELSRHGLSMAQFINWLAALLPENIDDNICHKFQNAIQRLRPWLLFSVQGYSTRKIPKSRSSEISSPEFNQVDSGKVRGSFRLSHVLADIELPSIGHLRMVLDALSRKDWLSATNIITDDQILDHTIHTKTYEVTSWPLWAILSIFIAHHQFSNHDYANKDIVILTQALHSHVIRNVDDFEVEICWWNNDIGGWGNKVFLNWRVLMNILKWLGKLEKGESNPLIHCPEIGMPNKRDNEAILRACEDKAYFALRSVLWKGKQLPFFSTSSRVWGLEG
ncbi:hypothetical protein F5B19DRAFT_480635 [Rostrohypoxylon terebratum]|nr:hypothetical protein F5B19DRAFT_480635 [Rostrohypoxylon terebratum]